MHKKDVALAILDLISPSPNRPNPYATNDEAQWLIACDRDIAYEDWADKVIDRAVAELRELIDSGELEISNPEVLDEPDTLAGYKEIIKDDTSNILHDAFHSMKEHNSFADRDAAYPDETGQADGFVWDNDADEDDSEYKEFRDTFYDNVDLDDIDFWLESASASDGIAYLKDWKKTHPDSKITEEEAERMYQEFINDRLAN